MRSGDEAVTADISEQTDTLARIRGREAALREILRVISQNREDEQPVFEAIIENAQRLCGANMANIVMGEAGGGPQVMVATRGGTEETIRMYREGRFPMDPEFSLAAQAIVEQRIVHAHDLAATDLYRQGHPNFVSLVEDQGVRTNLLVPLISSRGGIGCLILFRNEVRPYSDDEIALVETFADQAVIAIENVRQFRELQTRLEREAATSEVLGVISQYRDDDIPVFEAILENAARLCKAPHAFLQLRNAADTHLEVAAQNFATSSFLDLLRSNPIPIHDNEGSISVRGMHAATPTQYDDIRLLKGTELYTPQLGYAMDTEGMRTALFVPLRSEGKGIGVIVLYKHEVDPFSADEISLVQTFAAQAVIAIENVKQFKALEALNAELGDRVEEQVGEIERMGRLKRFLPAAVADALVSSGDETALASHRALIATLFCDIRGFTAFCETAEPEETIEVLQAYHEEMGKLISAHGGGVDKRMGDGIMVLFNDPLPCDDPAGDAVRLAIAMQERMGELCAGWKRLGHRLGFGVGISLGYATIGMVGSEGRYDYTASGTAVNLAARLCDRAEDGEVLLSPRTAAAIEDGFQVESNGEITLKGIREPVEVFRLVGAQGGNRLPS
ncbi:MAG TPA: GAF domain-containing protein [Afifellaceae bacterium]|nr:GAF domain-containing protein [Afifellaceae bacterium]